MASSSWSLISSYTFGYKHLDDNHLWAVDRFCYSCSYPVLLPRPFYGNLPTSEVERNESIMPEKFANYCVNPSNTRERDEECKARTILATTFLLYINLILFFIIDPNLQHAWLLWLIAVNILHYRTTKYTMCYPYVIYYMLI